MANITFIVTDSSMKHDYLFIGSKDNFFGSRDHWQYLLLVDHSPHIDVAQVNCAQNAGWHHSSMAVNTFVLVQITFRRLRSHIRWLRSFFQCLRLLFSLAVITCSLVEIIYLHPLRLLFHWPRSFAYWLRSLFNWFRWLLQWLRLLF